MADQDKSIPMTTAAVVIGALAVLVLLSVTFRGSVQF